MFLQQVADISAAVGPNEQILYDRNRDILQNRRRLQSEGEIAKVAGSNWPKATSRLLKASKHEKFSVDKALLRVRQNILWWGFPPYKKNKGLSPDISVSKPCLALGVEGCTNRFIVIRPTGSM
jgi:hypothetical protein